MKKIYRVTIVGPTYHCVYKASENVISNNKSVALDKLINKYPMDTVWSSNVEFNLKETIKYHILKILGLKYIEINWEKKDEI